MTRRRYQVAGRAASGLARPEFMALLRLYGVRRLIALAGLLIVAVVFGLAQVVLPGIAAGRIRDKLAGHGQVRQLELHAFPAIELLWHHADRLSVQMDRFHGDETFLTKLLDQGAGVGSIHASAGVVQDGLLTAHDATVAKAGSTLTAIADVRQTDIQAAVGNLVDNVVPVASQDYQLILRGTVPILAPIDAVVAPRDGKLIVAPELGPLTSAFEITLFSDPHIAINSISATSIPGGFAIDIHANFR